MRNPFQLLVVMAAIFGLGIGAAFAAGSVWGRRDSPTATPTQAAGAQAGGVGGAAAGGAAFGGGAAGGAGGAGGATTGVVEEINGDTVTVRTQAGGTVAIKVQPDTQVRQLASATSGDIKPGQTVIVTGQPDVDGKVAARSVQITGTGGPGGAQGGAPASPRPGGSPGAGQGQRSPAPRGSPAASPGQ